MVDQAMPDKEEIGSALRQWVKDYSLETSISKKHDPIAIRDARPGSFTVTCWSAT